MTDQEELELLQLEKDKAMSVGQQSQPEPMFSSPEEANVAMQKAQLEQQQAESNVSPMGFIKQHPFLSLLQGGPEFLTGQSLQDRVYQSAPKKEFTQEQAAAYKSKWGMLPGNMEQLSNADQFKVAGGALVDQLTSPSNLLLNPTSKGLVKGGTAVIKGVKNTGKNIVNVGSRIKNSFTGPSSSDLKARLDQATVAISNEKINLESLFNQKAKDITFKGKQVIPQISKGMSDAYEQGLNDIFTKLEDPLQISGVLKNNAAPITKQEVISNLETLVGKASNDPLIIKSSAFNKTVEMLDDIKNSNTDNIDIRNLIGKVREIKATIKASTTNGTAPISGQDYFATQFDRSIGGLLKDRVNGFKELQASYAPMANTRKVAYKIFKPLSDEDNALTFLNRIKNDNMKISDEKLLKFLQDGGVVGNKKIPGMGEFYPDIKNIGTRLKEINSQVELKQMAADISKKAADEKFRNNVLLWTAGSLGVGKGTLEGIKNFVIKD